MEAAQTPRRTALARWQDVAEMCHCGRSKALMIIHQLGPTYVGRTPCVMTDQLEEAIREGGIRLDWHNARGR